MAALSSADSVLDGLNDRLAALEGKVKSKAEPSDGAAITAQILAMNKTLQELATKHEKVSEIWAKYSEMERAVSHQAIDDASTATPIKEEIIIAGADMLFNTAKDLEELGKLQDCINSQALEDLPDMRPKLRPLEAVHIQQQDASQEVGDRLTKLLTFYNDLMLLLSKKFLYWDQLLSHAERRVSEMLAARE